MERYVASGAEEELFEFQLGRLRWVWNAVVRHGPYGRLFYADVGMGPLKLEEAEGHVRGLLAVAVAEAFLGPRGSTHYCWVHDDPV